MRWCLMRRPRVLLLLPLLLLRVRLQVTVQGVRFRGRYHADSKMWELSVADGATVQGAATQGGTTPREARPPRVLRRPARRPGSRFCALFCAASAEPLPPPRRL